MFGETITIKDYICLLFKLFEDESDSIDKSDCIEIKYLNMNILKNEYKYFSFFMLTYLINKVSSDKQIFKYIISELVNKYIDKYPFEIKIIVERIKEYLNMLGNEMDLENEIKKISSKFAQHVNGGIGITMLIATNFLLFEKYNIKNVKEIVDIINTEF